MAEAIANKKFQRTYSVQIQSKNGDILSFGSETGEGPLLTMEFSVKRDVLASVSEGTFRIKNLNQSIRSQVYHDWYDNTGLRTLTVKAGYVGTPLSTMLSGIAQTVHSAREEGSVDWVTEIEGNNFVPIMAKATSDWTMDLSSTADDLKEGKILARLINDLKLNAQTSTYPQTLTTGIVGSFGKDFSSKKAFTASGFTWDILRTQTNALTYIDNGKVNCLPNNYVFDGDVTLISSSTGLLGTPKRYETFLVVEMMFEPSLTPGQRVQLDTSIPEFNSGNNGVYKVTAVQHSGIISSTVSGKCKTIATLQFVKTPFVASYATNPGTLEGA